MLLLKFLKEENTMIIRSRRKMHSFLMECSSLWLNFQNLGRGCWSFTLQVIPLGSFLLGGWWWPELNMYILICCRNSLQIAWTVAKDINLQRWLCIICQIYFRLINWINIQLCKGMIPFSQSSICFKIEIVVLFI